jgi:asparagine synthase (glutamine-hydrolysing)
MITASLLARSEWATSVRALSAGTSPRQVSEGVAEVVRRRVGGVEAGQLERAMMLDSQLGLVDDMLHYFDRMSMAHSLEVRVPFLDHRLVEFAATIPASLKIRGGQTKYLLRRIAADHVPRSVLERPKVGFFSTAVEEWLTSQLDSGLADVLRDPSSRISEFVDSSVVSDLLRNRDSRRTSRLLFSLLILELWLSRYLPRALVPSAVPGSAALH